MQEQQKRQNFTKMPSEYYGIKPLVLLSGHEKDYSEDLKNNLSNQFKIFEENNITEAEKLKDIYSPFAVISTEEFFWKKSCEWVGPDTLNVVVSSNYSSKVEQDRKMLGLLEAGADDYIKDNSNFPEINAKLNGLLKRKVINLSNQLEIAGLSVDFLKKSVSTNENINIHLTKNEWKLISRLALSSPKINTPEELGSAIWPDISDEKVANGIRMLMYRTRNKLGEFADKIKTVEGLGYVLTNQDVISVSQKAHEPADTNHPHLVKNLFENSSSPKVMIYPDQDKKSKLLTLIYRDAGFITHEYSDNISKTFGNDLIAVSDLKSLYNAKKRFYSTPIIGVFEHEDLIKSLEVSDRSLKWPIKALDLAYLSRNLINRDFKSDRIDVAKLSNRILFDSAANTIKIDNKLIPISAMETKYLLPLIENFGNEVSILNIFKAVGEKGAFSPEKIRTMIMRLRDKFDYDLIKTVKGGYKMVDVNENSPRRFRRKVKLY